MQCEVCIITSIEENIWAMCDMWGMLINPIGELLQKKYTLWLLTLT